MSLPENEFTAGQKAIIEQTAYKVGEVVYQRVLAAIEISLKLHTAGCHAKQLIADEITARKGLAKGIAIVVGLISSVVGAGVTLIIKHIL